MKVSHKTERPIAEPQHAVYRTSPARVGKMMAIMLGICIVGGAIFFGMWDYWISEVPPVVAAGDGHGDAPVAAPAQPTGETIRSQLSFVESDDFRDLTFNALPGEPGSNPTIHANVGDEIIFDVVNDGISFHSFGVTRDTSGVTGIIPGTEIATMSNPLKPGEDGTSTFVPAEAGEYYYICTVPGHREQGMVGTIVVGDAASSGDGATTTTTTTAAAAPTGVTHDFSVDFVESDDFIKLAFNALEGGENHNPAFTVNSGDEVTFTAVNVGKLFHSFGITADPTDFANPLWGSEIASMSNPLRPGESGSTTFIAGAPGQYYYICTVPGHAFQGMSGPFIVE